MNKAFELILKKIEEKRNKYQRLADGSNFDGWNEEDIKYSAKAEMCEELKEIVQEVAEEYNDGWISVKDRLPNDDKKQYIVQKTNGFIDILGFTKDAYKLDRYDFAEYEGKKKQLFYDYDSEYGYIECECVVWQPLPEPFKESD